MSAPDRAGGVQPPVITGVRVVGLTVEVAWTWDDHRSWDRVRFRMTLAAWDPAICRFGVEVVVSDEELEAPIAYRAGLVIQGSHSHRVPRTGLYRLTLEVSARDRPPGGPGDEWGRDLTWRAWRREKVLVGGWGWTVVPLPGAGGDRPAHAADDRFRFRYELYLGPTLVRDCELAYVIGWPGVLADHDCDPATGERTLVLGNPRPGTPGAWWLTFAWADGEPLFAELRLASERDGSQVAPRTP